MVPPALTINNGIGKRTGMCDAAGSEAWSYDITANVGWKVTDARTTNGVTKTTIVQSNLAGGAATLTYPSGRVVTYAYNAAAQPVSAMDDLSVSYASGAVYAPTGALVSLVNGASVTSTLFYDKRLQPCRISVKNTGSAPTGCSDTTSTGNVLDYTYDFSLGAADNGNVMGITNNRDTTRSQSFTYDSLNRITTAKTQATTGANAWGLQFGYDPWGNLLTQSVTQGSAPILNVSTSTNNRLAGYSYDAAGNMLSDGSSSYTYNGEGEMASAAGVTYIYDGDGKRVSKSNGKLYWYGVAGDPLDETDAAGNTNNSSFAEYIFFGGRRIAKRDSAGNVNYYFADHLGTARVVASATGTILDDSDFYPYGGERPITSSSGNRYKFNGKERDAETGNDNFGARSYSPTLGRWLSSDWSAVPVPVPYADLGNPQTLNLYAMVRDNPETFADLDGHAPMDERQPKLAPGECGGDRCRLTLDEVEEKDWQSAHPNANPVQRAQQQQAQRKRKRKAKQTLTFNTISGGQDSKVWVIQWQLSQKSEEGGWIVQQLTLTDSHGKQALEYWEAWQVPAGSEFTTYHGNGSDDTFSAGILRRLTATASARFYEGLELPDSFTKNNGGTLAGTLRSTTINPQLPTNAATDSVDRTWTSPY